MPDITKQPYLNIIKLYTKLKVIDPIKITANVNVHNKNKYVANFEDYELMQTGGGTTKIKIKGNEFDFNSYHIKNMAFYNLLTPDEQACIAIEIDKSKGIAHIESLQFSEECFQKCATEKNGSVLLKACLKLLDTIKDKYKLRYVWLRDSSEKYCAKVKDYVNLDSFYMLLHGNTWYGKYGFKPFNLTREITDKLNLRDYNNNQKIVTNTLLKNTNIKKIILKAIAKHKLNFSINEMEQVLTKYEEKNRTVMNCLKDLAKQYDRTCKFFYYCNVDILMDLKMRNLHDGLYWKRL